MNGNNATFFCAIFSLTAVGCVAAQQNGDRFPELKPQLDAPKGFSLKFSDGPDFYVWRLTDSKKSGVGIYFGLHPNLEGIDKKSAGRLKGKVCGRDVEWWIDRKNDGKDPQVRRDVVLTYEHGKGFMPIQLHVWVFAPTEDEVANLAKLLENLKFTQREPEKAP